MLGVIGPVWCRWLAILISLLTWLALIVAMLSVTAKSQADFGRTAQWLPTESALGWPGGDTGGSVVSVERTRAERLRVE